MLTALAETDAVKVESARRGRRARLETAYGHAIMYSKGFSAEEAHAAFTRASELASGTESAADQITPYHAQWVQSFARAELHQARVTAGALLQRAEEGGSATDAGIAHRSLGATFLLQGDLVDARAELERTLADYSPKRDT